jgi:hypothetical protein
MRCTNGQRSNFKSLGPDSTACKFFKGTLTQNHQAAKRCRELIKEQSELPLDKQWTMGALIKEAKVKAYVLREAEQVRNH